MLKSIFYSFRQMTATDHGYGNRSRVRTRLLGAGREAFADHELRLETGELL
jgi:hypothetical protein